MSEAELCTMRARLQGGLRPKAARGALTTKLPVGFVYAPTGQVILDPDQQVQETLCLFFTTFRQRGSSIAVVRYCNQQGLTFPLLSDFNKQVIRAYGVFNEDMIGLKGIAKRAVFVLDKDGVVRHRAVLDDARNEPDYGKVYSALASLS